MYYCTIGLLRQAVFAINQSDCRMRLEVTQGYILEITRAYIQFNIHAQFAYLPERNLGFLPLFVIEFQTEFQI